MRRHREEKQLRKQGGADDREQLRGENCKWKMNDAARRQEYPTYRSPPKSKTLRRKMPLLGELPVMFYIPRHYGGYEDLRRLVEEHGGLVDEQCSVYTYQLKPTCINAAKIRPKDYYRGVIYAQKWVEKTIELHLKAPWNQHKPGFSQLMAVQEKHVASKTFRSKYAAADYRQSRAAQVRPLTIVEGLEIFNLMTTNQNKLKADWLQYMSQEFTWAMVEEEGTFPERTAGQLLKFFNELKEQDPQKWLVEAVVNRTDFSFSMKELPDECLAQLRKKHEAEFARLETEQDKEVEESVKELSGVAPGQLQLPPQPAQSAPLAIPQPPQQRDEGPLKRTIGSILFDQAQQHQRMLEQENQQLKKRTAELLAMQAKVYAENSQIKLEKDKLHNELQAQKTQFNHVVNLKKLKLNGKYNIQAMQTKDKLANIFKEVRDFTNDEMHCNFKRILAGDKPSSLAHYNDYCTKLNKLEALVTQTDSFKEEIGEGTLFPEECIICNVAFDVGEQKKKLACGHDSFHQHCIDSWLDRTRQCPICKHDIE